MPVSPRDQASPQTLLLTLLGGATLGAIAVALSATRAGKRFRDRLKALGGRRQAEPGCAPEVAESLEDDQVQTAFI